MKVMKRLLLGMVTAASGVLIACAYGMTMAWRGRVVDSGTSQPIPGIRVTCEHLGITQGTATTNANGEWALGNISCDQLTFTDVDGAANGAYDATTLENPYSHTDINTALDPTAVL